MFKQEDAVQYFRKHEGVVSHMYLDIVGLVTVGVGFLLSKPGAASALAFVRRDTGARASSEEKAHDWEQAHQQVKAKPAAFYKKFTQLDLPDGEIDRELTRLLQDFARNLRNRFPKYDKFPGPAQIGLMDMIYSLGPQGLFKGFPTFCKAVDEQDWKACAKECVRRGVSDGRNADCKQLFLDAIAKPLAAKRPARG